MYYIYHIPGKKVGVTKNLEERITKQQGYKKGEYEILFSSSSVDEVSDKEIFYQKKFNYTPDFNSFKTLYNQFHNNKNKNMSLNITEQTTTFPVAKSKIREYLKTQVGYKFMLDNVEVRVDDKVIDWIDSNARTSHFRKTRSYVYNQSLKSFIKELVTEHNFEKAQKAANDKIEKFNEQVASGFPDYTTFADIRAWATERGLYEEGDVKTQYVKLQEEAGELAKSLLKADQPGIVDDIGDIAVVLTNLAHLAGHNIEDCIDAAYEEIKNRKGAMNNGTFVKSK